MICEEKCHRRGDVGESTDTQNVNWLSKVSSNDKKLLDKKLWVKNHFTKWDSGLLSYGLHNYF